MKLRSIQFIVSLCLVSMSLSVIAEGSCKPDQSIKHQKIKKIAPDAQALLAKVVKDKINFQWPVKECKCWLSSLFGMRKSGFHNGLDLAAIKGTPVYVVADGQVEAAIKSTDPKGYGNMIFVNHVQAGYKTRYAHLDSIQVKQGDLVMRGQQIGTVGATGHVISKHATSDPSHLHFEVYRGQTRINPLIALFAADPAWVAKNLPSRQQ